MKKKGIDWDAVLADANARVLTQAEVAREQGVTHVSVWRAQTRRGVELKDGRVARDALLSARWDSWFQETPPETIRPRDFARRYGVSAEYARIIARARGLSFKTRGVETPAVKWRLWLDQASAEMRLNDFCRLHGVSPGIAATWARRLGHRFAPSARRAMGLRDVAERSAKDAPRKRTRRRK